MRSPLQTDLSVAVDLVAKCPGGAAGGVGEVVAIRRVQDRARRTHDQAGAIGGLRVAHHRLDVAALRADAGHEERNVADNRAHLAQLFRPGRADDQRAVAVAVPLAGDFFGDVLVERASVDLEILQVARDEPIRNRVMLALAYDAALRREELCSLRSDDLDPAHRTLRVRAETTKTRHERVVPYSAPTGVLLSEYLQHRATLSRARGGLFLSESRRNHAQPVTLWTWSKVVRRIALAANLPRFSTHTTRHLCLTDLARMGWELHAIATFAGHRSTDSTLQYIHLSGRELSAKLNSSMAQIHAWRIGMLTGPGTAGGGQDASV